MPNAKNAKDTHEAQGAAASLSNPVAAAPSTAEQNRGQMQSLADQPLHVDEEVCYATTYTSLDYWRADLLLVSRTSGGRPGLSSRR